MKSFIFLLFAIFHFSTCYAVGALPNNLIPLQSKEGIELFRKNMNQKSIKLVSHFTTQINLTYCGVASAVMILNSSELAAPDDEEHPSFQYFNQSNFFNDRVKKIVTPEYVSKNGVNLATLSKIIEAHGMKATPFYSNEIGFQKFKSEIVKALNEDKFVIVNFLRSKINQNGGLHHSPIAAYDESTDQFLVLDVSRYKYPSYWIKAEDLWNSTNVFESNSYHGFIIVEDNQ